MFTIHVRDFQSIADAEIEVDGLTVVTGQNNTGKSAVFRSVYGTFTNPRGTSYVRHGKTHCAVRVTFADGRNVLWEKGEGVNRYTLDGKLLNLVGRGVPPEVAALGVQPLVLSGNREPIWPQFAHQFTGQVFLLDQPGSVLAEAISDVDRVGVLNEALRLSQADHRSGVAERKVRQADVLKLETQEKAFDGLDAMDAYLTSLDILDAGMRVARVEITQVRSLQERYARTRSIVQELTPIRGVEVPVAGDRIAKIDTAYQWLLGQRVRLQEANRVRDERAMAAAGVGTIRVPEPLDLTPRIAELQEVQSIRVNVRALEDTLVKLRAALRVLENEVAQADRELADLKGQIQECPTCGALSLQEDPCPRPGS
jgi:hypothetical protein